MVGVWVVGTKDGVRVGVWISCELEFGIDIEAGMVGVEFKLG